MTEAETRKIIDKQLRKVGWEAEKIFVTPKGHAHKQGEILLLLNGRRILALLITCYLSG